MREIEDLFLLREAIELVSIRRVMDSATEADWQAIEAAGHRYEEQCKEAIASAVDASAVDAPVESDLGFHISLVEATHSERITQWVRTTNLQAHTMVASRSCPLDAEKIMATSFAHVAIYQAMRTGQTRTAEKLLRAHIADTGQRMLAIFRLEEEKDNSQR